MKIPKQSQPVFRGGYSGSAILSIHPSDCPDGTLSIWFPDGTSTSVPNIVPCCYDYPNCDPCGRNWDAYVGQHFTKQCGINNSFHCVWQEGGCNL
jgi:hypothetical protein